MTEKANGEGSAADRPFDPEKVLRLASVARSVYDEARSMDVSKSPVDELAALHSRLDGQLRQALPNALVAELDALDLGATFSDGASEAEVRLAYASLIGWLQGLFQGLQAAMQVQAMSAARPPIPESTEEETQEAPGRYL